MAAECKMDFSKHDDEICILVACTGSVASIKLPELLNKMLAIEPLPPANFVSCSSVYKGRKINVRLVTTEKAKHFYNTSEIPCIFYDDTDEWTCWKQRTDPVLHIELRKWADIMVIAPLDANTLAKLANGLCDNLLTCIARAWDFKKSIFIAPAMNTFMWEHPVTSKQMDTLKSLGYVEIPCIAKTLVCGDKGLGAMAEINTIVKHVLHDINNKLK